MCRTGAKLSIEQIARAQKLCKYAIRHGNCPEAEFNDVQFLMLEAFLYNVYITNQLKTTFAQGSGGSNIRQ